jgi:hypothetical protein
MVGVAHDAHEERRHLVAVLDTVVRFSEKLDKAAACRTLRILQDCFTNQAIALRFTHHVYSLLIKDNDVALVF